MHNLPRIRCLSFLHLKPKTTQQPNQILVQFITNGLKSPTHLAKFIEQYCSLSQTHQAHLIFCHFRNQSLYLFNTLIRCSRPTESLRLFANRVSEHDQVFDDFSYIFVLGACARLPCLGTLWFGRQVQALALKNGAVLSILVQTTLIHFYSRNGDVRQGRKVFDEMTKRSIVTWNAMISGYCSQRGKAIDALLLFKDMLVGNGCGERPNDTTMVCVLSASSQLGVLESGACIHGYMVKTTCMPEYDVFAGTGLVDMYSKCGCLKSALIIFGQMRVKNVLTWTALASGLAIHGKGKEALKLLDDMVTCGIKPNAVTITSLFSACCHAGLVEEGFHLFHNIGSKFGVQPNIQHYGCIVDLLGRTGNLKEAYDFIMGMPVEPDAILWRSLLSACKVHGDVELGEKVGKMLLRLQPEKSSLELTDTSEDYVALSNIYASAERWEDAEMVRKEMKIKGIENKPGASLVQASSNHL